MYINIHSNANQLQKKSKLYSPYVTADGQCLIVGHLSSCCDDSMPNRTSYKVLDQKTAQRAGASVFGASAEAVMYSLESLYSWFFFSPGYLH